MRDFKSNERKPIQIVSIQSGQTWSAAVEKTSPDSSMIVKGGKGVRKLNKPLKTSKICKETQSDAKRRKTTERNGKVQREPDIIEDRQRRSGISNDPKA